MGESWLLLAETQKNSDVYNSTKACFLWKAFLGKPATITFGENKDVNSWIKLRLTVDFTTILLRQPSEELVPWEQTPEHHGIDPNTLNSGHHDCSTQAVFLCTAVKLQSCHMLAHWTQHTGPSHTTFIRAKASVVLSSSFREKITLGLALGESWLLLAETQKNSDVYNSTKACFLGKACLGKPATITFGENKDANSWIKLRLTVGSTTILLRQPSEELVPWEQTPEHHGIDPNMLNSGHHDCSTQAVFLCTAVKLQSRHMLAHRTQHTGPYIHPRTDIYRQTCINHLRDVNCE